MKTIYLTLLLFSCQTSRSFHGPDGEIYQEITCNGSFRSVADCYDKAAEVCGGKYKVLNGNESTSGYVVNNFQGNSTVNAVQKRSIIVECQSI